MLDPTIVILELDTVTRNLLSGLYRISEGATQIKAQPLASQDKQGSVESAGRRLEVLSHSCGIVHDLTFRRHDDMRRHVPLQDMLLHRLPERRDPKRTKPSICR